MRGLVKLNSLIHPTVVCFPWPHHPVPPMRHKPALQCSASHSVCIIFQTRKHKTSLNTQRVNVSLSSPLFSNFQFSWIALLCFINIFELLLIFLLKWSALIHIWSAHQGWAEKWMWKDTLYLQKCKGWIKNI